MTAFGITGCHRWDIHNGIHTLSNILSLGGMLIALHFDFGLIGLASANLLGTVFGVVARSIAVYRVCDGLSIRAKYVKRNTMKEMFGFASKSFAHHISRVLLTGTGNVLIASYIGPAGLALFARPTSLVRHVQAIITKYSTVIVPTASSMSSSENTDELLKLTTQSCRIAAFLTLPPILFFIFEGGNLLNLWMGPTYAKFYLIATIALLNLFPIAHSPLHSILLSLNKHGRIGILSLVFAIAAILTCYIWMVSGQATLLTVAIILCSPRLFTSLIVIPRQICQEFSISYSQLMFEIWTKPTLATLPMIGALVTLRSCANIDYIEELIWACSLSAVTITISYWFFALPSEWKQKIKSYTLNRESSA